MRCAYVKPDGNRCEANRINGSDFCFSHEPGRKADKLAAVKKGGEARKLFHKCGEPISISGPKDVQELLARTIEGVWLGMIPANQPANTIGFLARCYLDALESVDLSI